VRRDLMDDASYKTLMAVARVSLHTRNGTIFDQIERAESTALQTRDQLVAAETSTTREFAMDMRRSITPVPVSHRADGEDLHAWNGFGGFDRDGRDYVIRLDGRRSTPHPWINVIANASFGFHTSAEGASFTWSRNSRDFQLTPWSNDPVSNRPGEAIYIYDHTDGQAFSPFAAVLRDEAISYEARHGQGVSTFTASRGPISTEVTQLVDPVDPVKISRLRIRNSGGASVRLRVYAYAEWVLGNNRCRSAPTIVPSQDQMTGALLAKNAYSLDFGERVAFLASDGVAQSVTADRAEFIGRGGSAEYPHAAMRGLDLSGKVEAGIDPCAAMAREVEVAAGGEVTILFLLGDAASPEEARDLVVRHRRRDFDDRLAENESNWRDFLDTLQVETPDKSFNALVNNWLPYQSLACRIRARSAFYQASGAFGFRDQLQDTLALMMHDPKLARDQILNAGHRQFQEGDVQHWWLPRTGAGVRTMISDDVVWLAYGTASYVNTTGDTSILQESIPFIEGEALEPGQHDNFFTPEISDKSVSLYEHCARALDLAIRRTSAGGLPLILGGDWNDGMNRVGEEGKGESVWLGWFLLKTLGDFAAIARDQGDTKRADKWEKHAKRLKQALEKTAWDGQWYRRGSYDDGTLLGSHLSEECKIDSIAQSWSVLSGQGDPARSKQAMDSAMGMLVDGEHKIVKLFTPPFANTDKDPGYIKSYPPGVRENGGQYTHASTWFVIALAEMGRADDAYRCFSMLNPVNHSLDEHAAEHYRVEPYVVVADIYSEGDKAGRGGWTWYTGSAGWLYRAAVEAILGIRREGQRLTLTPVLPSDWPGYSATLKLAGTVHRIRVEREAGARTVSIEVDGKRLRGSSFEFKTGSKNEILVRLPG
jgi:cyclic beta-1,2-glucan synthetase